MTTCLGPIDGDQLRVRILRQEQLAVATVTANRHAVRIVIESLRSVTLPPSPSMNADGIVGC